MIFNKLLFEQGCEKSAEFIAFSKEFKKQLKKEMAEIGATVENYLEGHFFITAFVKTKVGNIYYISWHNGDSNLMYRTAEHLKDYTGGSNNYKSLEEKWTIM